METERIITIAIMAGLFGGIVGGPIASLVDYYAPPQKLFPIDNSRIYWICMFGFDGLLWKVRKKGE